MYKLNCSESPALLAVRSAELAASAAILQASMITPPQHVLRVDRAACGPSLEEIKERHKARARRVVTKGAAAHRLGILWNRSVPTCTASFLPACGGGLLTPRCRACW